MNPIQTIIVDDEPLARKRLQSLLQDDEDVQIIAICENGKEAIQEINSKHPDLVLLDIQMPEVDGFNVLQHLEVADMPAIIFVTAYDEFAIKAFDIHAVDYLLKPFDRGRFELALARAKSNIKTTDLTSSQEKLQELIESLDANISYVERLMIKQNDKIFFIQVQEVEWFQAAGNYVEIHHKDKSHLIRDSLSNLEQKLNPDDFTRIHRSTIVNINKVKELESWFQGGYRVVMQSGDTLTMTRNYNDLLNRY